MPSFTIYYCHILEIFQSNILRSIDDAQYKHYAALYKSPLLFCLDVPFFFRKLMLTFYCYFINS